MALHPIKALDHISNAYQDCLTSSEVVLVYNKVITSADDLPPYYVTIGNSFMLDVYYDGILQKKLFRREF